MISALWELLNDSLFSLNAEIIWSYQNAARITKPYIVVNYTTVDIPDHEFYGKVDANGVRINSSWRKATVDLQFYGAQDSYSMASKAASLLASSASLDKQVELDVSIGIRLFLQRVPALLNESQFEDRAIYQFEFYYTENIADDGVGNIETVIVDGYYPSGISELPSDSSPPGANLTDLYCHHSVLLHPVETTWDENKTTWDNELTIWDVKNG